jgi:hypothetical protein
LLLSAELTSEVPPAEDPWRGKRREDLELLLGVPDGERQAAHGGRVLTYKLVRLADAARAPDDVLVLDVPGVGVVGRLSRRGPQSGAQDSVEPTEVDNRGRSVGGGITTSESHSISWDKESGNVERSWEERPALAGRVTLRFELAGDGTITSWSAKPPPRARKGT